MKKAKFKILLLFFADALLIFSCKRETSCEGCINGNKPPIAIAGPDQVITLPTDSTSLDGSASNDPDGTIREWRWAKISGPASFNIVNATASKTVARDLDTGIYQFELLVKDDGGLTAKDTFAVTVVPAVPTNQPPIANAGSDTSITLPANAIQLDGSRSSDPDNNISSYSWTKISGPQSFNITNANAVQTQVINLTRGIYQFKLEIKDAGSLYSKDTVQITVNDPMYNSCPPTNRPIINAQLIPVGNLSIARSNIATVSCDNKLFFAGGSSGSGLSSRVDIYDLTSQVWSTAELSLPRKDLAAVACANKVIFAGGTLDSGSSSRVDIYDISTKLWSTAELSKPRASIIAATIGNKVFFAGGCSNIPFFWTDISNRIDIYDIVTNAWSIATLSETRIGFTATTAGSKIYFAGGWNSNPNVQYSVSPTIDIYDDIAGTWSTSTLNYSKAFHASFFKGGKIYWAGGGTFIDEPWIGNNAYTCQVEVRDLTTQTTSLTNLYAPLMYWVNSNGAFEKDGCMVLIYNMTGDAPVNFEVYNIATQVWSKGILTNPLGYYPAAVISANNTIFFAGGSGANSGYSSQVWKLVY